MKILKCHIENFGRHHDLTIDFTENPQIIYQPNGWGKSTLAAFIQVMFYGFANERKQKVIENERRRYRPWQGGTYGGEVVFEANGKTYSLTRIFETKEKDDSFQLFDAKTNLESTDYSKNIGEELFLIDRESFGRTVFIAQNDITTKATDSINAKIGNLTEITDDINNYETVQNTLKDQLNQMSPTRKTGTIKKTKEQIAVLKQNIYRGPQIDQTMQDLGDKLGQVKEVKTGLKTEQAELQRQTELLSSYNELQKKQEKYEWLLAEYNRAVKQMQQEQEYFPAGVPDEDDLQSVQNTAVRIATLQGEMNSLRLTAEDKQNLHHYKQLFGSGEPSAELLQTYKKQIKEYDALCTRIAREKPSAEDVTQLRQMQQRFDGQIPQQADVDQYIEQWQKRTNKLTILGANREKLQNIRTAAKIHQEAAVTARPDSRGGMAVLILGCLLLVFGGLGIAEVILNRGIGFAGVGIGAIFVVLSLWMKTRPDTSQKPIPRQPAEDMDTAESAKLQQLIVGDEKLVQAIERETQKFFEQCQIPYTEASVLSALYELNNELLNYRKIAANAVQYQEQKLEAGQQAMAQEITAFLNRFYEDMGQPAGADDYLDDIQQLIEAKDDYVKLQDKLRKLSSAETSYQEAVMKVTNFLQQLQMEPAENLTDQLQEIRDHVRSLQPAKQNMANKLRDKSVFEQQQDVSQFEALKQLEALPLLEDLNRRSTEIIGELEAVDATITEYEKQLDEMQEKRSQIDTDEENLNQLQEQVAADLHQFEILKKTKEYLELAKENFTARYIGPVMDGFVKYHYLLAARQDQEYKIDANINIMVKEHGAQRDVKLLSTGYQDLIGLCMRMALVDVMFQAEKPFIIIDDSFANLDDGKVSGGLKFLEEVAKEYQVIYFTCHESRSCL